MELVGPHSVQLLTVCLFPYLLMKAFSRFLGMLFTASMLVRALAHRRRSPRFSQLGRRERRVEYRESTCARKMNAGG